MPSLDEHYLYLDHALELAKIKKGFTAPNPAVGAVLVKSGKILSSGYHKGPGTQHAEVSALEHVSEQDLADATLYVTLEPCNHQGRTPPCTDMILVKGIKKVYFAYRDPNPHVIGHGQDKLIQNGVKCEHINHPATNDFYQSYNFWHKSLKPMMIAKLALTMDGKIAWINGQPCKISGPEAFVFTHQQRKEADALLTTAKTILADNPSLNVRINDEVIAKPLFVLDRNLSLTGKEKIFSTAENITLFYDKALTNNKKFQLAENVKLIKISAVTNQLNLSEIISFMGTQGFHQIWVEAGGTLVQALLKQSLLQRLIFYICPQWLGSKGLSAFGDFEPSFNELLYGGKLRWGSLGRDGLCVIDFFNT